MTFASDISGFLINTFTSLYLIAVVLRGILQASQADFYNPISQVIVQITRPPLSVLQRVIPKGQRFDPSVLILAVLVQAVAISLLLLSAGYAPPNPLTLGIWSLIGVASLLVSSYLFAILAMIVVSWVAPGSRSPAVYLLYQITEPVMTPVRSIIPNIGPLDLSPIAIFIVIQLLQKTLFHMAISVGLPPGLIVGM